MQVLETVVFQEERPAGKAGADAALQPRKSILTLGRLTPEYKRSDNTCGARGQMILGWRRRGSCNRAPVHVSPSGKKYTLQADHDRIVGQQLHRFIQQSAPPLASRRSSWPGKEQNRLRICCRAFRAPCLNRFARCIIFLVPDVNLHNAGTHCLPGMKLASSFIHGARMVQQPDVRQNGAKPVIGMRQIVLQRDGALEFGDRFQMLKVFRWSPQQKGAGHMSFRQLGIDL